MNHSEKGDRPHMFHATENCYRLKFSMCDVCMLNADKWKISAGNVRCYRFLSCVFVRKISYYALHSQRLLFIKIFAYF